MRGDTRVAHRDPDQRSREAEKQIAAGAAAQAVEAGMLVGLGTGSTVAHLLDALGERVRTGLAIRAVATSEATEARARAVGIPVEPFAPLAAVDLAIDGVDEIDPQFRVIKGAGGALLREKVIAEAAATMIVIADASKPVDQLGRSPVPVELLDFAQAFVAMRLERLGGEPHLRKGARTDQGNPLIDCRFGSIADPERLAAELEAIPGVIAHGLFLEQVDRVCIGTATGPHWQDRRTT